MPRPKGSKTVEKNKRFSHSWNLKSSEHVAIPVSPKLSFEELLLDTVKSSNKDLVKKKKQKMAKGAEVITREEGIQKLKEIEEQKKLEAEENKKKGRKETNPKKLRTKTKVKKVVNEEKNDPKQIKTGKAQIE